jgi:hypothetical protein
VIAAATFTDTSATLTFPRWFGYFNIWYAVLAAPAAAAEQTSLA